MPPLGIGYLETKLNPSAHQKLQAMCELRTGSAKTQFEINPSSTSTGFKNLS
jgi:hypothetical protein